MYQVETYVTDYEMFRHRPNTPMNPLFRACSGIRHYLGDEAWIFRARDELRMVDIISGQLPDEFPFEVWPNLE